MLLELIYIFLNSELNTEALLLKFDVIIQCRLHWAPPGKVCWWRKQEEDGHTTDQKRGKQLALVTVAMVIAIYHCFEFYGTLLN